MSILKFFTIIVTGVVVSITTTGLATNLLISKKKIDTNVKIVSVGGITSSGKTDEKAVSTTAKSVDPWESPVLKAAFVGMCLFAALRLDMLLIACASVFSLQFGKALPAAVRAICPAVITCAGLTAAVVSGLGFLNGVEVHISQTDRQRERERERERETHTYCKFSELYPSVAFDRKSQTILLLITSGGDSAGRTQDRCRWHIWRHWRRRFPFPGCSPCHCGFGL
jgi:hypothetical protein